MFWAKSSGGYCDALGKSAREPDVVGVHHSADALCEIVSVARVSERDVLEHFAQDLAVCGCRVRMVEMSEGLFDRAACLLRSRPQSRRTTESQPAAEESYRLLLLTDVHYGNDHEFRQSGMASSLRTLGDLVADALKRSYGTEEVDALILGGDFFSRDQPHDVPRAADGLKDLLEKIPHTLAVATPGNHDLVWDPPCTDDPFAYYNLLVEACGLSDFGTASLPKLAILGHKSEVDPITLAVLIHAVSRART